MAQWSQQVAIVSTGAGDIGAATGVERDANRKPSQ